MRAEKLQKLNGKARVDTLKQIKMKLRCSQQPSLQDLNPTRGVSEKGVGIVIRHVVKTK